jgi:hypothetical protein
VLSSPPDVQDPGQTGLFLLSSHGRPPPGQNPGRAAERRQKSTFSVGINKKNE